MLTYLITFSIFTIITIVCIIVLNLNYLKLIRKFLPIVVLVAAIIACLPLLIYFLNRDFYITNFIIDAIFIILIGILYVILSRKMLSQLPDKPIETFFSFAFLFAFVLALANLLFLHFVFNTELAGFLSWAAFFFLIPPLVVYSFGLYTQIPKLKYEEWILPDYENEPDYDSMDLSKINIVDIEFQKNNNDDTYTKFTLKAPLEINFGQWFYGFVKDYNVKFIESPIQSKNSMNQPSSWLFYIKPSFWSDKKYIDPKKTIKDNNIKDKTWIIAKRVN
jgi:hypothetical protein